MGQVHQLKRLIVEDFPQEYSNLVSKLAYTLNPALEEIAQVLNGQIDFSNLVNNIKTFEVTVDGNGDPTSKTVISTNTNRRIQGLQVIYAENLTDTTKNPTSTPFITFELNSNDPSLIEVKNVTGLQADDEYRLRAIVVAN